MVWLYKNLPSLARASATAPRPWLPFVALIFAMTFASATAAQQDGGCSAPDATAVRAESLSAQWKAPAMREALDGFERARSCWSRLGQRREEAGALKRIGDIHLSLSEYTQALEAYGAALARWREVGDRQAEAHALVDLSRALLFTPRLDEVRQNSQEAASTARTLGDRRLEARAENVMGKFYYRRGDYEAAAAHYEQALSRAREAGDAAEEALALYQTGQVHSDIGDLSEALHYYQRALPLWRAANDRQGEVKTLASMGLTYSLLGESQTALDYLDKMALPFLREAGDRRGEAAAHNSIGHVYQSLGDYETALSHYRDALTLSHQIGVISVQALASIYIGNISAQLERAQEAQENYERALALSRAMGNSLQEAEVLNSMGELCLTAGKENAAYELFRQALLVYEKGKYQRGQAAALNNIGWYFGGRGDWREAGVHFRRALGFCHAVGDRRGELLSLYNIARADLELGDEASALSNVEAGLRIAESLRTKVASSELRASYFASVHRQFELYITVLMKMYGRKHDPALAAAAFEASERGRARSLLETLAEAHVDIRWGVDPALLQRERELQFRLDAKTERRVQLFGAKAAAKEVAEIERQIDELTGEYHLVQGQIRASSPRYAALVQPVPLTLRGTQQKVLDADTLLLEYALGDERSFLWAVTPDSIKSFELPARAEIEKASRRVYELLTTRNRQVKGETGQQWQARILRAEAEYADASAALGRILLGPVAAELGRKRLVIVADGALQYVSFAALPVPGGAAEVKRLPESAGTRRADEPSSVAAPDRLQTGFVPLIAEHEVVSLPSASVLALTREEMQGRRPAPKSVAVLADPVFDADDARLASAKRERAGRRGGIGQTNGDPGGAGVAQRALRSFDGPDEGDGIARLVFSQREARAIMASVPAGDGMLALGFRASRATAMSPELAQYRTIHFATHGLLNSEHPELSGIVLSLFDEAGKRQDGFLQLHEVYGLNLLADLVVLSACQTALGKEIRGEGLVGLTRGFMYAGAARVVASLWKVDDAATAELMGEFYKEMLGEGLRPAAALRAAQVRMWQQNRWRSPYYWAAFTLQGEWR